MNDAIRNLGEHPFLRGLEETSLARVAALAHEHSAGAGSFIFREGDPADALYLLLGGRVALEQHIPGQGAAQVESLHGGDILGLSWFFPPYRWRLDARAVESVRAFAIDAAALRKAMDEDVALGYAISKRLTEQLYTRLERVRLQRLDVYGSRP